MFGNYVLNADGGRYDDELISYACRSCCCHCYCHFAAVALLLNDLDPNPNTYPLHTCYYTPAQSRTSRSSAPVQRAVPMAPTPHGRPRTPPRPSSALMSDRRLPAHCIVVVTVCAAKRRRRSATDRDSGRRSPTPVTSSWVGAGPCGTGRWLRT